MENSNNDALNINGETLKNSNITNNTDKPIDSTSNINSIYTKKYLENSFINQTKYRIWIWYKLWPLLFRNYLGLNIRDTITVNCVNSIYNSFSYFQTLSKAKDFIIERDYKNLEYMINTNSVGVDEVLDPISMQRGIHYSVLIDDPYLVNYYAEKGANLMIRDAKGYTALLKACCLGRLDTIKVLLEHGVPIDHRDPDNLNCLDLAKKMDKTSVVDYINSLPNKKLNQEKIDFWLNQPIKEYYNTRVWWIKSLY